MFLLLRNSRPISNCYFNLCWTLLDKILKSCDSELGMVQYALNSTTAPITCLWAELLDNNLVEDTDSLMNNVLNVIQYFLVLQGDANKLVSLTRRCNIIQFVDKS